MKRNTQSKHGKQNMFRTIAVLLLMAMTFGAKAQVFMMDGDENYREPEDPSVFVNLPQGYGLGVDWYTPTGSGLVLLAALGGAYLIGKRRKEE
jgi:hypothetical protein